MCRQAGELGAYDDVDETDATRLSENFLNETLRLVDSFLSYIVGMAECISFLCELFMNCESLKWREQSRKLACSCLWGFCIQWLSSAVDNSLFATHCLHLHSTLQCVLCSVAALFPLFYFKLIYKYALYNTSGDSRSKNKTINNKNKFRRQQTTILEVKVLVRAEPWPKTIFMFSQRDRTPHIVVFIVNKCPVSTCLL